jgi:hypothetical protein
MCADMSPCAYVYVCVCVCMCVYVCMCVVHDIVSHFARARQYLLSCAREVRNDIVNTIKNIRTFHIICIKKNKIVPTGPRTTEPHWRALQPKTFVTLFGNFRFTISFHFEHADSRPLEMLLPKKSQLAAAQYNTI